jgi:two-component system chemotaxis sensor kinase CheA
MTIDMSQFYQVFFEEAGEHLASMETLLLALDVDNPSLEDLNAIFRAAHSIKGGSGTFGFTDMTEVTHVLETLLDRLRKEELHLRPEMVDAFLAAGDVLRAQLEHHQGGPEADAGQVAEICATLAALASGETPAATATSPAPATVPAPAPAPALSRRLKLTCSLSPEAAADDEDVSNLLAALAELAHCEVMHRPSGGHPQLVVRLDTDKSDDELKDVFSFHVAPEAIEISGEAAVEAYGFFDNVLAPAAASEDAGYGFFDEAPAPAADPGYGFFDDAPALAPLAAAAWAGAPGASAQAAAAAIEEDEGFGLFIGAPGSEPEATPAPQPEPVATAPAPKPAAPAPGKTAEKPTSKPAAVASAGGEGSSIRVAVEKVDQLINLVGELVITQAMLAEAASYLDPVHAEKLLSGIDLLSRNTRDLQESVMSIRMLPMSMVFSRFPRVVRDLAGKLGKQVELKTVGEGTELDKGLIEKITDPLTHLVRNSLDHGIETPDKRIAAGKVAKGTLTLKASHQGGNIVIEVMDDGGGLNRERILAKAREKGMNVSDAMSDSEVWQLIMAPGFSTAEQITDVSGRGVGMDVVKKNIEGLGGKVELESSPGFGTRIIIRLPLTLAILDGMSVGVGGETFIVPLTAIVESLQPREDDIKTMAGDSRVVQIRGEYLPLIPLADIFGLQGVDDITQGIIVVVEAESGKAALFVDALLGQHQVVIKSLEANYRKVPGISGATIMGDGSVALILDMAAVCRLGLGGASRRLAA